MTEWITEQIESLGYAGVALLMFLENLFPPLPSEVVMPLAGYIASRGELDIALVIAAGIVGTDVGALFWYAVARRVSDEGLKRWADSHGRWITLSRVDIEDIERWFERHRTWAVPLGHLIPGIRTLISIPAGVFAMPLARFLVLTTLGAGIWTGALGIGGYLLGQQFDQVDRYLGPASTAIMAGILIFYLYRVATFDKETRAPHDNPR